MSMQKVAFVFVLGLLGLCGCGPSSPRSDIIPGLAAVDVHGNFTNKGFTLEKRLDPVQSEWRCKDENGKRSMLVEAFGDSATSLTMVRGTYTGHASGGVNKEAAEFLGYVASIPYDGSRPSEARGWVERNIGSSATTSIGDVSFELVANRRVRMLIIKP
jgi:hypothetical protein